MFQVNYPNSDVDQSAAQTDHKFRLVCEWNHAISLLADSVLTSAEEFPAVQMFSCYHPILGPLEIALSCVGTCSIRGHLNACTLETLSNLGFLVDTDLAAHHPSPLPATEHHALRLVVSR